MPVVVDVAKVRRFMDARGLDMTGLANAAGMSRQGVYRLLGANYRPLGRGMAALAEALGVDTLTLLEETPDPEGCREILQLTEQAATGEPRAFELLPAALHRAGGLAPRNRNELSALHHQILAAAAAVAAELTSSRRMASHAQKHSREREPGRAFFFAARFMTPDRIVAETPPPMKPHLVFGSFNLSDFARDL